MSLSSVTEFSVSSVKAIWDSSSWKEIIQSRYWSQRDSLSGGGDDECLEEVEGYWSSGLEPAFFIHQVFFIPVTKSSYERSWDWGHRGMTPFTSVWWLGRRPSSEGWASESLKWQWWKEVWVRLIKLTRLVRILLVGALSRMQWLTWGSEISAASLGWWTIS